MELGYNYSFPVDERGYPKDLPNIEAFPVVPYYMPALEQYGVKVEYENTQFNTSQLWTVRFFLLLNTHFNTYHNHSERDKGSIISQAQEECEVLFAVFVQSLERAGESPSRIVLLARCWVETTKGIVWSAFRYHRLSTDTLKKRRSTAPLLKELITTLDSLYETEAEDDLITRFPSYEKTILFNLWADRLYWIIPEIKAEESFLTTNKKYVDYQENKKACYATVEDLVKDATSENKEAEFNKKVNSCIDFVEKMFVDYCRRFQQQPDASEEIIVQAINHWEIVFLSILQRVFTVLSADNAVWIAKEDLSCLVPNLDGEELYAYEKRSAIVESTLAAIKKLTREYLSKGLEKPWTARLLELGIDYAGLYQAMKDDVFSGISFDVFRSSFAEADFHTIMASANKKGERSGKRGCVYFLISELGHNLGDEWLLKAAESVCEFKGKKAITKIRSHSTTDSMKDMRRHLTKHITNYRLRPIRKSCQQ